MIESSSVVVVSSGVENKSAADLIKVNLFFKILLLFIIIILLHDIEEMFQAATWTITTRARATVFDCPYYGRA